MIIKLCIRDHNWDVIYETPISNVLPVGCEVVYSIPGFYIDAVITGSVYDTGEQTLIQFAETKDMNKVMWEALKDIRHESN
jgi:hypothetical protein